MKKLFVIFMLFGFSAVHQAAFANMEYGKINTSEFNKKAAYEEAQYQKEEAVLGENYAILYRIADKIIRANGLQTQNWRFSIQDKVDDVNAASGAANLVIINSALFDSIFNNDAALAFVIGHEMGHFLNHHAEKTVELKEKIERNNNYGSAYMSSVFAAPFAIGPAIKIKNAYKDLRNQEIEADRTGLYLMTAAGFDPAGSIDAMSFIAQLPESKQKVFNDTYPKTEERIQALKTEISTVDIQGLKSKGENNLFNSDLLRVKESSDRKAIIIVAPSNKASFSYNEQVNKKYDENTVSQVKTPARNISNENITNEFSNNPLDTAFQAYYKNDTQTAEKYFKQAYNGNKNDYTAPLYLSYIYTKKYKADKDEETFNLACFWMNKAFAVAPNNARVKEQKQLIDKLTNEIYNK